MINMLVIKILLAVMGLSALVGGIFYLKYLVQENAVLEATLESTTAAMADYAVNVETEINAYQQSLDILSSKYQGARDRKYAKINEVSKMDLQKLLTEDAVGVESELNRSVNRLYKELEALTRNPRNPHSSSTAETRTP